MSTRKVIVRFIYISKSTNWNVKGTCLTTWSIYIYFDWCWWSSFSNAGPHRGVIIMFIFYNKIYIVICYQMFIVWNMFLKYFIMTVQLVCSKLPSSISTPISSELSILDGRGRRGLPICKMRKTQLMCNVYIQKRHIKLKHDYKHNFISTFYWLIHKQFL